MPPSISTVHIDQALTDVSIEYQNLDFAAADIFPIMPVGKKSNKYFIYDKTRFRPVDDARGPGSEANEVFGWNLSTDNYNAEGHALKDYIPDEIRDDADPAVDIDITTTQQLTDLIQLNRELALYNKLFGGGTAVPNTTLAGQSQWSDFVNSDPITAVETAKNIILQATGKMPNRMAIGQPVFSMLRNHPRIIDRIKYNRDANNLDEGDLAAAFGLEKVIVPRALQNTATEGQADSLGFIWQKVGLLYYRPASIGKKVIALGAHFTWNYGVPSNQGYLTKRWREEKRTADAIETQLYYDQKVIAPAAGFAWLSAVA